jgi:hypothetical protein
VEEDKNTCARIFRTKVRSVKADIRFCRRVRLRSRDPETYGHRSLCRVGEETHPRKSKRAAEQQIQQSKHSTGPHKEAKIRRDNNERTKARQERARKKLEIAGGGKKRREDD